MRIVRYIVFALVVLGLSGPSQVVAAAKANTPVVQETIKKQTNVPRPKTNWSKIKELFM
jgi:hypothetical protein